MSTKDAQSQFDQAKAEAFAEKLLTVLNNGAMWGEEKTREYLERAGFRSIQTNTLEHDPVNNWHLVTK